MSSSFTSSSSSPSPSSSSPSSSGFAVSLTPYPGASDGLSPSLSSVHTASSQGSQAQAQTHNTNIQYTYGGSVHGAWPTPANSSYHVSSASQAPQPLGQSPYGARPPMYGQQPASSLAFGNQRSSQSPATGGDGGLPAPPYESVHQAFNTPISGGGGGGGGGGGHESHNHHSMSPGPHGNAMLTPHHNSTQPPATSASSAPSVDPYAHSRPPNNPSYYAASTTPHQPNFSSYAPHPLPSPTNTGPASRGIMSVSTQHPQHSMGPPPGSYRHYGAYQHMQPAMNGPVMSNIHQPGAQLSVIPALGLNPAYNGHHPIMYGHHSQPQPQSERPFKCDQCTQSFSRNHDLKRHKRIHLAVKPFPCTFCSKSFSRKDALKRHRLVKGCENKFNENAGADCMGADRNGDIEDDRSSAGKEM